MTIRGIDEAWAKADPTLAAQLGYSFIIGYVSEDTTGKNLTASQIQTIHNAGLAVGLVYEYNTHSGLGGWVAGQADAEIAVSKAKVLGAPSDICIWTAVDWDVTEIQKLAVLTYANYFDKYCRQNGYSSGVYGGYWVCKYLADNGYPGLLWQTYAWSGGLWERRAVLRQLMNGILVGKADVDLDVTETTDIGLWWPTGTKKSEANDMYVLVDRDGPGRAACAGGRLFNATDWDTVSPIMQAGVPSYTLPGPIYAAVLEWLGQDPTPTPVLSGLSDSDRALLQTVADAVSGLNHRLATE